MPATMPSGDESAKPSASRRVTHVTHVRVRRASIGTGVWTKHLPPVASNIVLGTDRLKARFPGVSVRNWGYWCVCDGKGGSHEEALRHGGCALAALPVGFVASASPAAAQPPGQCKKV